MVSEEPMKFNLKRRATIFLIFGTLIWIFCFSVFYVIFSALEFGGDIESGLQSFFGTFAAILATIICVEVWVFGVFELIEKSIVKRNLKRHLEELDKKDLEAKL
jgi:hypothetical protein